MFVNSILNECVEKGLEHVTVDLPGLLLLWLLEVSRKEEVIGMNALETFGNFIGTAGKINVAMFDSGREFFLLRAREGIDLLPFLRMGTELVDDFPAENAWRSREYRVIDSLAGWGRWRQTCSANHNCGRHVKYWYYL